MEKQTEFYNFPTFDLKNKVAIVTGSGGGLGKWIALGLAHAGADIFVADLTAENPRQTSEEIRKMGRKAVFMEIDLGDIDSIDKMMKMTLNELGSVDILINNAGFNVRKKALDITLEDYEQIVRINSKGVYFCCQAAARLMIPQKRGKIVNIASATAFLVRAGIPNSVYAMTKAGVVMLTKALAEEWAQYNINVNAVAPGYFATPLGAERLRDPQSYKSIIDSTPLKRVGGPADIMGALIFLASEASDFITGQTISIDGGRTVL